MFSDRKAENYVASPMVAAVARGYCRRPRLLLSPVVAAVAHLAAVAHRRCYRMLLLAPPVVADIVC